MSALKPDVDSTHDLGTTTKRWRNLFVDGITVTDDITVAGNLTVEGTTFSVETTNLQIEDPLIKLNRGDTANPANDQGFVFSRGNGTAVDKANRVLLWDESEDEFAFGVAAEEAGTTVGDVAITGYSDVSLGKLVFNSVAGDAINVDTDLQLNAVSDIKLIPGGGDVQVTGNVLPAADDTYDLGSSSAAWQDLFLEGDITLTDAGTLATSAGALTITGAGGLDLKEGDASIISISDARAVALANLTTFDLDGSGAISLDGASLSIGGGSGIGAISIDSTAAISLDADAASHLKTSSGDLTLEAEANDSKVVIKGDHESGVAIHLDGNANANSEVEIDAGILDINVTGAATIDGASLAIGAGAVTIDSTAGISLDGASASNFTLSDGDLSLIADGADNKVVIKGDATSADSDVVSIHLDGDEGTRSVVDIDAGILDIDASGSISIDSDGAINIGTADDDANISIGTDGDRGLIKLGSESGASSGVPTQEVEINATHVDINALTSGYQISGGGASSLTTSSGALTITSNQASSWSTSNGALTLNGAGGLNLQEGGADVIAIDDNKDVLFSHNDGSAADPDVQFDGFVLFSNGGGVQFNESTTFNEAVSVGADDTGYDVILYGATAGSQLKWNQATDALRLTDSSPLEMGDSQDMKLYHDGTDSYLTNATGELKIATIAAGSGGTNTIKIGNDSSTVTLGNDLNVTGNLTVTGTTVTSTVEVISTQSGVLFEGPTNDGHEATLKSVVEDSNKTYTLPNVTGYVALYADDPGTTAITATPSELNYLDITNLGQSEASKVLTADASGDVTLVGDANNVVWDKSENALEFADSASIELGTGLDMTLYHDGTDSHITNSTGTLNIATVAAGSGGSTAVSIGNATSTVTMGQDLVVTRNLTAAKATVENIDLDDKTITMTGSENDTATIVVSDNGALAITTTDTAAAAANMTLTADGTFEAVGTTITLDSGGDINLEPAAGNKILLDGTISIDGGVVDGATSITSDAFVGTLSTAAQGNITSLGTLTGLGVNGDATFTGDSANMVWDKSDNALEFADSAKLLLGDHGDGSGDLELYHDGTNSHIINRTGTLNVANSVNVPVSIGHGSSTTTIGGALTVTGNLIPATSDGAALGSVDNEWADLYLADEGTIQFGDGQNVRLVHETTGGLVLKNGSGTSGKPDLTILNENGDGESAGILLKKTGGSPAAGDDIGEIRFEGEDSADNPTTYARISTTSDVVTSGGERGGIDFEVSQNGNLRKGIQLFADNVTSNIDLDLGFNTSSTVSVKGSLTVAEDTTLNGDFITTQGRKYATTTHTTATDLELASTHHTVIVTNSSATISIPDAGDFGAGREFILIATVANVVVTPDAGDAVYDNLHSSANTDLTGGGASFTMSQHVAYRLLTDGNNWYRI